MDFAAELYALYKGLPRARGKYVLEGSTNDKGKKQGRAVTLRAPYKLEHWIPHLNGTEGLGVVPITDEGTCRWACIDIDKYPIDLIDLEKKVNELHLPFVIIRSKSGGCHLTVFFSRDTGCLDVVGKLQEVSARLGYNGCEVYPKQIRLANTNDIGNWLNMPYFGAAKGATDRFAIRDGEPLPLEEFIEYAKSKQVGYVSDIVLPSVDDEFADGPPCLQTICSQGISEGGRNTTLFNIGVYIRLKYESDWESHIDDANRDMIDPPLSFREVGALVKSLEKKNYAFTCNTPPILNFCNRELCKKREYGVTAFQHVDIGVVMDSITKVNSEPPMWIISLDGVRTEVETEDMLDQQRFRKVCMNAINKIPGRMKGEEWDKFIRSKLNNIEVIDAPTEAKFTFRILEQTKSFFEQTPMGRTIDELSIGRWIVADGHYVFRGVDFILFLERQGMKFDPRKVWHTLSMHEVVFGASTIRGLSTQTWHAPLSMYGRSKTPLTTPEIKSYEDF